MLENLKNLKVLYVEDDKLTRHLTKSALKHLVNRVYLAKNGEEGFKLYKLLSPDIVLTDMYMPKMNGLEMSQKIKSLDPKQVIGVFTGDSQDNINEEMQSLNIDTYIIKPINRKQFFKSLEHLASLALST